MSWSSIKQDYEERASLILAIVDPPPIEDWFDRGPNDIIVLKDRHGLTSGLGTEISFSAANQAINAACHLDKEGRS